MREAAIVLLLATVSGLDGEHLRVDRGLLDGLRLGDRGAIQYTVVVRGEPYRIEAGTAEVVELSPRTSRLRIVESRRAAAPGYRVLFELSPERLRPTAVLEHARDVLTPDEYAALEEEYLGDVVPRPAEGEAVWIPSGEYWLGVEPEEAAYFNETPRHRVFLDGFWVDRRSVRAEDLDAAVEATEAGSMPAVGMTFLEARDHCRRAGKRLIDEFEWEVAMQKEGVDRDPLYEWTSSWYRPYPGNRVDEVEYGETYRVLRGGPLGPGALHRRSFLPPGERSDRVGFRCVRLGTDPRSQ